MKIKFKKNLLSFIIENIYFILLSLFVFVGYIIVPSYSVQAIILLIISILILMLFRIKTINISKDIKWYILYMFLSLISICYSNSTKDSLNYILLLIALFTFQISLNSIKYIDNEIPSKIIYWFSFVHVFATILQLIFPNFIQTLNKINLTEVGYLYNTSLYKYGCFAGICSDHGANAIFISIFLTFASGNLIKNKNFKNFIFFVLGMLALFLTGKRGYLIAVIFAFVITLITFKNDRKNDVLKKILFLGMIILFVGIILKFIPETSFVFERFLNLSKEGNILNGRENIYEILINNIKNNWVLGSGINSTMSINLGNNGHNAYLQIFSELGIFGLIFFIGMLINNLKETLKYKEIDNVYSTFYQIFFICIAFTGNPMHYIPTLIIYFLVVSKLYIGGKKNESSNINLS